MHWCGPNTAMERVTPNLGMQYLRSCASLWRCHLCKFSSYVECGGYGRNGLRLSLDGASFLYSRTAHSSPSGEQSHNEFHTLLWLSNVAYQNDILKSGRKNEIGWKLLESIKENYLRQKILPRKTARPAIALSDSFLWKIPLQLKSVSY